ncbi:MAG: hypothetical protein ACREJM_15100, partial [Candidatus Saccharimonadales bacterium]
MNAQTKALDIATAPGPLSPEAQTVLASALALCDDSPVIVANSAQAQDAVAELATIKGAAKRV